jgi:hypothetical protein
VADWTPIRIVNTAVLHTGEGAEQIQVDVIFNHTAPEPWHKELKSAFSGTPAGSITQSYSNSVALVVMTDLLEDAMTRLDRAIATANTWYVDEFLSAIEAEKRTADEKAARDQAFTEELQRRLDAAREKSDG